MSSRSNREARIGTSRRVAEIDTQLLEERDIRNRAAQRGNMDRVRASAERTNALSDERGRIVKK